MLRSAWGFFSPLFHSWNRYLSDVFPITWYLQWDYADVLLNVTPMTNSRNHLWENRKIIALVFPWGHRKKKGYGHSQHPSGALSCIICRVHASHSMFCWHAADTHINEAWQIASASSRWPLDVEENHFIGNLPSAAAVANPHMNHPSPISSR